MRKTSLRTALICSTTLLTTIAAPAAFAEDAPAASTSPLAEAIAATKPIFNFRVRYETVDEDLETKDTADALTYRIRAGLETGKAYDTSFLVEFDLVEDVIDDYNSTINGKGSYSTVADPQVTELNRIQLTNTSIPDTKTTLGRQRIILDDSRFVGNVGWRQNEQTFDALRMVNTSVGKLTVDGTYMTQVNRIFGDDSAMGRFSGDTYLLNVSYPTPIGKLTGFGYWIDTDEAAALSSETLGFRLAGGQKIGEGKLGYAVSYANQKDFGSSNLDYTADYYLLDASYAIKGFKVGLGYEVLAADEEQSFQTPLATLHKFQGWADKFLTNRPDGMEDLYASAGYTVGDLGPLKGVKFLAVYHDFSAESSNLEYGSELDLLAAAKWKKLGFTLKYADYSADDFSADTQKIWLQLDYAY